MKDIILELLVFTITRDISGITTIMYLATYKLLTILNHIFLHYIVLYCSQYIGKNRNEKKYSWN